MTKKQTFTLDEAKRNQLRDNLPLFLEVLEALKEDLEAEHVNEGVVNPNIGNAYYQQVVGVNHVIRHLPDMMTLKEPLKGPQPRRQFNEDDRDFLKGKQEKEQKGTA